jgi:A118 family predicted phage portal protein
MRPNRLFRHSPEGRSDLQGVEPWLDALDEAYSSWWRDIRHAKSRIHMPASMLDSMGPGQAAIADVDREVYVPVEGVLASASNSLSDSIDVQQFKIRVEEHRATCEFWTEKIIESAGYSTQSLSGDGDKTATEVRAHQNRSYMTRGKKVRYWTKALREHLAVQLEVAALLNVDGVKGDADIKVEFPDGVQDSTLVLAQTAQALRNAEAASTKTRVAMLHPDWDSKQVDAEVALILSESAAEPVPVPGDAGF